MKIRLQRLIWMVIALALICLLGYIHDQHLNSYYQDIAERCGIAITLAVSLNIVNGLAGQFSIGHAGFMAIGAYTGCDITYLLAQHFARAYPSSAFHASAHTGVLPLLSQIIAGHPSVWLFHSNIDGTLVPQLPMMLLAMCGGGLLAALFGYAVGVPSLRLRGDYLAIVTLGFGEIIRVILENTDEMAPSLHLGGATGFSDALSLSNTPLLFPLIAGTALVVIVLSRNLKFSCHGLAFLAVREDEIAAEAMGVNTTSIKVTAFVLSAFFAGIGGTVYAHSHFIKPDVFNFILSINYVVMIVLGGSGSITGATLAAVAVTILPDLLKPFRDRYHLGDVYLQVVFALTLVIVMIVRPAGVFGTGELRFWKRRSAPIPPPGDTPDVKQSAPAVPAASNGAAVLEVSGLTRKFGGLTAVGNVNITLEAGELVGLIGPNGAGKTTLFNLLTGVYEPSDGTISLLGDKLAGTIRYLPRSQYGRLWAWITVLSGVAASFIAAKATASLLAAHTAVALDVLSSAMLGCCYLFIGLAVARVFLPRSCYGQRWVRLLSEVILTVLGGWIVGAIMATVLAPFASTPQDLHVQAVVRWGCLLIALAVSAVVAPRRHTCMPGPKPYQFAHRGICRTFQNVRLFGQLTVLENVRIGTFLRRRASLFDSLFHTARLRREEDHSIQFARELLARFNLTRFENELARNLPYGDQRRLEIVRALATQPKLLLLDEPAAGMNPQEKQALMALIRQIRDDFGLTILLIEHDMTLVMGICERIYVLDYGVIIAHGTPQEIRSNPKVIAAYLGEETVDSTQDGADAPSDSGVGMGSVSPA